jgi:hypothetical protein
MQEKKGRKKEEGLPKLFLSTDIGQVNVQPFFT